VIPGKKAALLSEARHSNGSASLSDITSIISRGFFDALTLRLLSSILEDNPISVKASIIKEDESTYGQTSSWEELPSPADCLGLIAPLGDDVSVEVLRGSHWFPEFTADGISRWTVEGRPGVAAAVVAPNTYTDVFDIPAKSIAIVGPGLIHRVHASPSSAAVRILVLPSRQGSARFRQQVPADEVAHRSGARIWVSALT
jgi:hypothetical protein